MQDERPGWILLDKQREGEQELDQARGARVRELEDRPNLKELESELSVSPDLALRGDPHPVWLVRDRRRCCI